MNNVSDEEFLNELIKRSEKFADQECRKYAVKELERIDQELKELEKTFYIDTLVYDIIDNHIKELKGE